MASIWSRIERRLGELAGELLPDEYGDQVAEARGHLAAGRAERAVELLESVLAERPEHSGALALLGTARLELGQAEQALAAFERAEDGPDVLVGRGEALLALGQPPAALAAFRRAALEAGGDRSLLADVYRGMGLAHLRSGDIDKAVRELRKAVAEAPDDAVALAALGEAIVADRRRSNDEARRHLLRAVDREGCPPQGWLALGSIALDDGDPERARSYFERARELGAGEARVAALVGLGDAHRLAGELEAAQAAYEQALALDPRRADAVSHLADVHVERSELDLALARYREAAELGAGMSAWRRGLDTALRADAIAEAVAFANRILEVDDGDPRALVARGLELADAGQGDAAAATYRAALTRGDDAFAHLALARLAAAQSGREAAARAANHALDALRADPRDARALALLGEVRARALGVEVDGADYYQLAESLRSLCAAVPELTDLAAPAAEAAADFDRPLLVTVMGEFSSGKSSFVNAFIGAEVAPTGITPTTATINVVKHGRERGGRIVYQDGRVVELEWEPLYAELRDLSAEKVREVAHVEIRVPRPDLERVNLVDTPGLNSILPEHEAVARGFIARADAVVWLFTAQQAGKATEREALERIRDAGVGVLAVLNKIDQLSAAEIDEVRTHVLGELGEHVTDVVPISARRALAGEADSGWDAVLAMLEERFFARAREIKRAACDRRLRALIAQARERVAARRRDRDDSAAALRAAADAADAAALRFVDDTVARVRRELTQGVTELYRGAAREVLELVRPRRLPFGSHRATAADRDYLLGLLDSGYESLLAPVRGEVAAELNRAGTEAIAAASRGDAELGQELSRALADGVRWVEAEVFAGSRAYVAGYLRGGLVDNFFRIDLPRLELSEDAVYRALYRDSPDLDAQIAVPLARAGTRVLSELARRLEELADLAAVAAQDADAGAGRALELVEERRRQLAS